MKRPLVFFLITLSLFSCNSFNSLKESNYKLIDQGNTPFSYRVYELKNGLKVYLSENNISENIQAYIGVKSGSKSEPIYSTGLAHYIEHMLFNGTSKIGTDSWGKERLILNQISENYELRKGENNSNKKIEYTTQIDSLSHLAQSYIITKEYSKLINDIGGTGSEAYTTKDETVFATNFPANELEKWAMIESERFSELVLRNFHIELESIYEEYSSSLISEDERMFNVLSKNLFKDNSYNVENKFGKKEHLENPSLKDIHSFFDKYYIPNNMILSMAGNLEYEKSIEIISEQFGKLEKKQFEKEEIIEKPIRKNIVIDLKGKENNQILLGYKLNGLNIEKNVYLDIIDRLFLNGYNGFLDKEDVLKSNKVSDAFTIPLNNRDNSLFILGGSGIGDHSLEEIENLLMNKIKRLKTGRFSADLPLACLNDLRKENLENCSHNYYRANELLNAGFGIEKTVDYLNRYETKKTINKNEIVAFSNDLFSSKSVVVKKTKGEFKSTPVISPFKSNSKIRNGINSRFYSRIKYMKKLEWKRSDFGSNLITKKNNFHYIKNNSNELFSLNFIFDFGSFTDPSSTLALEYLKMIGSSSSSKDESNIFFYNKGLSWNVFFNDKSMTLKLEGLNSNFNRGLEELSTLFKSPKFESRKFNELIKSKQKKRKDLEFDSSYLLWNALLGKVQYGDNNPYISSLSNSQLSHLKEEEILSAIKTLLYKPHTGFYYGPLESKEVEINLEKHFNFSSTKLQVVPNKLKNEKIAKQVFFVDHDMAQSKALLVANKGVVKEENEVFTLLFNAYYNKLAFLELRESNSLALSSYIGINRGQIKESSDFIYAYAGCKVDKFPLVLANLEKLLKSTPEDVFLFESVKKDCINALKSKKVTEQAAFWEWKENNLKGFVENNKNELFKELEKYNFEEFTTEFEKQIKNLNFSLLIIGKKSEFDSNTLKEYGPLTIYKKHEILP